MNKSIAIAIAAALIAGGAFAGTKQKSDHVEMTMRGASCPAGFTRDDDGCVQRERSRRLFLGQRLPAHLAYHPVAQPVLAQLPPLQSGYQYVRVGPDVVLLHPEGIVVNIYTNLG